jgi:glucan 1,3-beta-glucosidase
LAALSGTDSRGIRSTRQWFWNQTNLDRTLDALKVLTEEFTSPTYGDTIIAIECLNEPFPQQDWELDFLKQFYQSAYTTVRDAAQHPGVVIALDEAFKGLRTWDGFMTEPDWTGVAMDTVSALVGSLGATRARADLSARLRYVKLRSRWH